MIEFIVGMLKWTTFLWLFFIVMANYKEKFEAKKLGKFNTVTGKILLVIFVMGDWLYDKTYGTVLFLQKPANAKQLLTDRLKTIIREGKNGDPDWYRARSYLHKYWQYPLAVFFCRFLIEPWDWNHCGLGG